jgi:transcriptional regulator with XRE-family HTH domain
MRRVATRPRVPPGDEVGAAEIVRQIAGALRDHRRRLSLSLQDLAESVGVSRAALSLIEAGRHAPRIDTLSRIAAAFGVPCSDLTGGAALVPAVFRPERDGTNGAARDGLTRRSLIPPGSVSEIAMHDVTLAPGCRRAFEPRGPGLRELVVVLSGAVRVTVADVSDELATGDSVVVDADVPVHYENPGQLEARCHSVVFRRA